LLQYIESIFPNLLDEIYYIKIQRSSIWRRWYAGHHSIVMNVKDNLTYEQFLEVLTHEFWHIIDLWLLTGKSYQKDMNFTEFWKKAFSIDDLSLQFYKICWLSEKIKKSWVYAKDFVSWYSLTDIFEDFAESFNMFVNHNWVFKKMTKESNLLKKKYNFFTMLLKWKYLQKDTTFDYKNWFRPWDSTRMSK
jgi:hypothetical protein